MGVKGIEVKKVYYIGKGLLMENFFPKSMFFENVKIHSLQIQANLFLYFFMMKSDDNLTQVFFSSFFSSSSLYVHQIKK